jgi:hypothetical protein
MKSKKTAIVISATVSRKLQNSSLPRGAKIHFKVYQACLPNKEELQAKLIEWVEGVNL